MNKIIPLLIMTCISSGTVFSGNFYNIEDESQLKSGSQMNEKHNLGFSDDAQAMLISPRLAISVRHGMLGAKDQPHKTFMSFYGKRYEIVRAIEHADVKADDYVKSLSHDITVFLLKDEVRRPDRAAVACPLGAIDYDKELPGPDQPLFAHTISQSPFTRIGTFHQKFNNTDFSSLYGKIRLSNSYFTPKPLDYIAPELRDDENFNNDHWNFDYNTAELGAIHDYHNPDPSLMLPVGGDSGSACYVRLKDGGYALIGAMARTSDHDAYPGSAGASYTPTAKNIEWLTDIENMLVDEGTLDRKHRFKVVTQDMWDFGDHTPAELIPAPRVSKPMGYLALNPDLIAEWAHLPFQEALAKAVWHRDTFAAQEGRRTYLSQGEGDPSLGTEDKANPAIYLALNADLQAVFGDGQTLQGALSTAEAHFDDRAKPEQRTFLIRNTKHRPDVVTLPDTFFPQTYLYLHPDVQREADRQGLDAHTFAKWHYTNFGFKEENRRFTHMPASDFWRNQFMYIALHPDIATQMSGKTYYQATQDATTHYTTFGFMEKRDYTYKGVEKIAPMGEKFVLPRDFDATLYLALHEDILQSFLKENNNITFDTLRDKAAEHYIAIGGPLEGRRYR